MLFLYHVLFLLLLSLAHSQSLPAWSSTPLYAPSLPIAVRSPYLNGWLPQPPGGEGAAPFTPPFAWLGTIWVLNWYAAVQVDGVTYQILGGQNSTQIGTQNGLQSAVELTATRTSFLIQAGALDVNLTFLSPIEPADLVRQSIPFSYMYIDVASNDNSVHDVKLYSDIDSTWLTGDITQTINWTVTTANETMILLQAQPEHPTPFQEINFRAADAILYFSMLNQFKQTWEIGTDTVLRSKFSATGALTNTTDLHFTSPESESPAFGISVDLGTIKSTSDPLVWAIGLVRDPTILAVSASGATESRRPYFRANFSSDIDVAQFFLSDFSRALDAATKFDNDLKQEAAQISTEYADIVSLSVRQTFAAIDITLSTGSDGQLNTSDVQAFMKDFDAIGSSGTEYVSAVDVIYSASPAFVTLNPNYVKYLLLPLLEYQNNNASAPVFAVHDLGSTYPQATGENLIVSDLGIEESANMLFMALAHVQATGDHTLINEYYSLFQKWANYLVENALSPSGQYTADELPGLNQTNLAIKGIIGIRTMASLATYTGNADDTSHFMNISSTYLAEWKNLSLSSSDGHTFAQYNNNSSWTLMYNLYADKLLRLDFIDDSIYNAQTSFYGDLSSSIGTKYGIPLGSSELTETRTDWMMFTAATVTDNATRDDFVVWIHNYVNSIQDITPFAVEYDVADGQSNGSSKGSNSPAQGAMFSLLALSAPVQNVSTVSSPTGGTTQSASTGSQSSSDLGAIIGGVVGGVAAVICILGALFVLCRRRHRAVTKEMIARPYSPMQSSTIPLSGPGNSVRALPPTSQRDMAFSSSDHRSDITHIDSPSLGLLHSAFTARTVASDGSAPRLNSVTYGDTSIGSMLNIPEWRADSIGPASSLMEPNSPATLLDVDEASRTRTLMAKQTLLNEELRTQVANLQREVERMREERTTIGSRSVLSMAPPGYL